jgi:hypothetical protein
LHCQLWSTGTMSPGVLRWIPNCFGLGLSMRRWAWTHQKVSIISHVRSAGGVNFASSWSSWNCMSSSGHTSNHSAVRGTERPSRRGRRPVTGMGGSPCGSGSPSPGYLGRTVRSANWGVGTTTFFAHSASCRANEWYAIRSSLLRVSSTTVCDVDRARYSLVAFS